MDVFSSLHLTVRSLGARTTPYAPPHHAGAPLMLGAHQAYEPCFEVGERGYEHKHVKSLTPFYYLLLSATL